MKKNQALDIHNMTAKGIISFVKGLTGKMITCSPKSKRTVINQAEKLIDKHLA